MLLHPPTTRELERLYFELRREGAPSVGARRAWPYKVRSLEQLIALAGDMLRYDARLLSILLQFWLEHEHRINPRQLRAAMAEMRFPQALLVASEFAYEASRDAELRAMVAYLRSGWSPVFPAERFFIDLDRPGSRRSERRRGRNLRAYAAWGFIGAERPTMDAFRKQQVGRYDARTRADILRSLVERQGSVSMQEYLRAVDHGISRAQARHDLLGAGLEVSGQGRGARWRLRRS